MRTILEAKNLTVTRGGSILVDVPDLAIIEGETLSLIGPNGAGKTTLLQALSFLMKPFAGDILFRGQAVGVTQSPLEYRRRLAMVFQEPLLFDTTVLGNVASGLKIRGTRSTKVRHIVDRQLERFGIGHLRDRSAKTLSGGEAQRTSLARAFAISPEILFLDEPFASLDPPTREAIVTDLEMVLAETETTTILATHDRNEALRLSDRIAIMLSGRIIQIDRPDLIINKPVNESVASFVGTETVLPGVVKESRQGMMLVAINGREIEVVGDGEPGEKVVLCIRPENVTLSPQRASTLSSARNVFSGIIERIVPIGLFYRVHVDCGFSLVAFITGHSVVELALKIGLPVEVSFKATAIHVIRHGKKKLHPEQGDL
jgi:tungstate transport system ATP-binding protein